MDDFHYLKEKETPSKKKFEGAIFIKERKRLFLFFREFLVLVLELINTTSSIQ